MVPRAHDKQNKNNIDRKHKAEKQSMKTKQIKIFKIGSIQMDWSEDGQDVMNDMIKTWSKSNHDFIFDRSFGIFLSRADRVTTHFLEAGLK